MSRYTIKHNPDDVGIPINYIKVRSLMTPPGIPQFNRSMNFLLPGPAVLSGRAWTGKNKEVKSVEVSVDNGVSWHRATIDEHSLGSYAWVKWKFNWNARLGKHYLCVRASDSSGEIQPDNAVWNEYGHCNNFIQRVPVTVLNYKMGDEVSKL
eukprot:TRINITY_DN3942_c0_g1_i2.p2 TRINITY_DN3942_c0_g1~~TRINITY_DN3942_c0_g1_i2.p2  ORF type:complete len:152 (-),score=21.02 TRINITY_DN3942_c0_g1_i2:84-539(-)